MRKTAEGSVEGGPLAGKGAAGDVDPLLAALCANPMRVEQMLTLPGMRGNKVRLVTD